jgi:hypothetical protein
LITDDAEAIHSFKQVDNNMLRECLERWDEIRQNKLAPRYKGIDLLSFPLNAVPACSIVSIPDDINDDDGYVYLYWGSKLTKLTNKDMTGESINSIPDPKGVELLLNQYRMVGVTKCPFLCKSHLESKVGDKAIETNIRLPLTADGKTITHVISFSDMGNNKALFMDGNFHSSFD